MRYEREVIAHIEDRLSKLAKTDKATKYLEMVNCVVNLLWEQENERFTGAEFSREWRVGNLKFRIAQEQEK